MPRRVVVLFGLVAFAGLCLGPLLSGFYGEWFSGFSGIPGIEDKLTTEASQELNRVGVENFEVSASGRDLTVTSVADLPGPVQADLRAIDGVGSVTFTSAEGEPANVDAAEDATSTDPDAGSGTSDSGTETDTDSEAEAEAPPEASSQIAFHYDGSDATMSGEVQTAEGHEVVLRAAGRLVGEGSFTDEISVSNGSGDDLDNVSTTAAVIRRLGEWYVSADLALDGDDLVVKGIAKSDDDAVRAQQVIVQLTERVGLTATVDATVGSAEPVQPDPDAASGASDGAAAVIEGLDLSGVVFELGTAELTADAQLVLDDIAARLNEIPMAHVQVQGHTDNQGDPDVNLLLSDDRARSVRDYLTVKGIDPDRLTARGFGASQPIADNSTAEGQAANRRVELVVAKGDN